MLSPPRVVVVVNYWFFKTGLLYLAIAVLQLTLQTRLAPELRNPPTSASGVLGSKVCATKPGFSTQSSKRYRVTQLEVVAGEKEAYRVFSASLGHGPEARLGALPLRQL